MKVLTNNQYLFFGEVNRSELYGRVLTYTFEFYVLCMIKIYVKIQFIMFYFLLILYSKNHGNNVFFIYSLNSMSSFSRCSSD